MTDIVERLRQLPSGWLKHLDAENTALEAADEIERLRGLLREVLEVYEPAIEWYWRVSEALGDQ
jgi:hypothetical protein